MRMDQPNLEKTLAFATGTSCVPSIGFSTQPTVEFLRKEDSQSAVVSRFPTADTWIYCLKLPSHTKYEEFNTDKMVHNLEVNM